MKTSSPGNALETLIVTRLEVLKKEETELHQLRVFGKANSNLGRSIAKWCADVDRLHRLLEAC